eukprot:11157316-Prorocentrum_lima.AAC.1
MEIPAAGPLRRRLRTPLSQSAKGTHRQYARGLVCRPVQGVRARPDLVVAGGTPAMEPTRLGKGDDGRADCREDRALHAGREALP